MVLNEKPFVWNRNTARLNDVSAVILMRMNLFTNCNWIQTDIVYRKPFRGRSICRWTGNDFQYGILRFWEKYGRETVSSTLDGAGSY